MVSLGKRNFKSQYSTLWGHSLSLQGSQGSAQSLYRSSRFRLTGELVESQSRRENSSDFVSFPGLWAEKVNPSFSQIDCSTSRRLWACLSFLECSWSSLETWTWKASEYQRLSGRLQERSNQDKEWRTWREKFWKRKRHKNSPIQKAISCW